MLQRSCLSGYLLSNANASRLSESPDQHTYTVCVGPNRAHTHIAMVKTRHRARDHVKAILLAASSLGFELYLILRVVRFCFPAGCQSCAPSWACPPIRSCQKKPPTCFCVQHCWRHPQLSAGSSTKQQWQHWITWSRRHQQQHQHPERVAAAWLLWRQQQSHRPRAAWICQVSSQGLLQQELSTRRECHGSRCPTLCCRSYGQVSGAQW